MDIQNQKKKEMRSVFLLILTAFIWGVAFVFQRTGMEHIGPFAFNFFRCLICVVFLLAVDGVLTRKKYHATGKKEIGFKSKSLWIGGLLAGLALFLAMSSQQAGMVTTSASKAGFITTMYIVLVPIMGIFYGRKTTLKMWMCVAIASVGLYLLSIKQGFVIERGDFLVFLSAIFFGIQIVVIDIFAPKQNAIKLSIIQFATTGVLSFFVMIFTETVSVAAVQGAAIAILYMGLMSSGIGFTLQIVAQKNLPPTLTSMIMSTESGFSVLAGVVILGERLTSREAIGCVVMIVAVILAQIQLPNKQKSGTLA